MKTKILQIAGGILLISALSSCAAGYTCPTYMKKTDNATEDVRVAQPSAESTIKS